MANQSFDNALVTQFSDMVHIQAQQMNARLRPYVEIKKMSGDIWAYDGLGSVEALEIIGRNQPVVFSDIEHLRRKISRRRFAVTLPLDASDVRAGALTDPQNKYAQAVVNAINRKFDRVVVEAMFASVYTGRDFGTTVAFTTDNPMTAIDATAGLTYAKLLEVKQNFINYEVGNEAPTKFVLGITGDEHAKLMADATLSSGDYSRAYVVDKGEITRAAGFDIILFGDSVANPIITRTTEKECFALACGPVQYGMCVGMSLDLQVNMDKRSDLIETNQVQAIIELGAVRTEGALVQKVRTAL